MLVKLRYISSHFGGIHAAFSKVKRYDEPSPWTVALRESTRSGTSDTMTGGGNAGKGTGGSGQRGPPGPIHTNSASTVGLKRRSDQCQRYNG